MPLQPVWGRFFDVSCGQFQEKPPCSHHFCLIWQVINVNWHFNFCLLLLLPWSTWWGLSLSKPISLFVEKLWKRVKFSLLILMNACKRRARMRDYTSTFLHSNTRIVVESARHNFELTAGSKNSLIFLTLLNSIKNCIFVHSQK